MSGSVWSSQMPKSDDPIPVRAEIEEQLKTMLAGPRFKTAQTQADILECAVKAVLNGKKPTQDYIGKEVFGESFVREENDGVRVNFISLRKTIVRYYQHEGAEDKVIISLPEPSKDKTLKRPKGEAYKPSFKYNPKHRISKFYDLGKVLLNRPMPSFRNTYASDCFTAVLHLQPDHCDALIGFAESTCLETFFYGLARMRIGDAFDAASKAFALHPENWHAAGALGMAYSFLNEMELAEEHFRKAYSLDENQTLRYGWFHYFLFLEGHTEEALQLASLRVSDDPGDISAVVIRTIYSYLLQSEEEQIPSHLEQAHKTDCGWWGTLLLDLLMDLHPSSSRNDGSPLAYGGREYGTKHLENDLQRLLAAVGHLFGYYDFPSLTSACAAHSPDRNEFLRRYWMRRSALVDFAMLPRSHYLHWLLTKNYSDTDPFDALERAWRDLDPIVNFIDMIPLFAPLRNDPRFREFLSRRRMPARLRPLI
jgi:tetratricopeptide (TPR) repeat protein